LVNHKVRVEVAPNDGSRKPYYRLVDIEQLPEDE